MQNAMAVSAENKEKMIGKNVSKTSNDHVSVVQVRDVLENFETFVSIKVCGKQMGVNSPR